MERAADLIAERGVDRTGLDDVLKTAEASKSQLYHYFADRDALIEAAVAYRCGQVHEALVGLFGRLETLDELERGLRRFANIYEQTLSGCPIGTLAVEIADRNRAAQERLAQAFDAWQNLFADLFSRLRDRGAMRQDADPVALATALLAALEGGQVLSQTRGNGRSLRVAIATALDYVRSFSV